MQFVDSVAVTEPRRTRDGYLVCSARVARTGVYHYGSDELGLPGPTRVVGIFRPESSVFDKTAMTSFTTRPVTRSHPQSLVTADNWKEANVIGTTGETVARDGEFLVLPMILCDGDAIKAVEAGVKELSCGYRSDIRWEEGEFENDKYIGVMENITGNHIALVERGRAGSACSISDAWPARDDVPTPISQQHREEPDMPDTSLRPVLVDGVTYHVGDQGAQLIERLQRQLADAKAASAGLHTQHDAALAAMRADHERAVQSLKGQMSASDAEHARALNAQKAEFVGLQAAQKAEVDAKDAEIAGLKGGHQQAIEAKDAEIAALQARIPDGAAMDALIAERLGLIAAAKRFLGDAFSGEGKTSADIRRAAVAKGIGEQAAAAMADEHVSIAFDTMVRMAPAAHRPDPIRDTIRTSVVPPAGGVAPTGDPIMDARVAADAARAAHLAKLENAWRQPAA